MQSLEYLHLIIERGWGGEGMEKDGIKIIHNNLPTDI